jgi:hypothetical protein
VAVSASLSSLSANVTYHVRVVATGSGGTSYGSDATFTTLPNPPAVVTQAATGIKTQLATLNGTVNPEGATVTDCHFEYGKTLMYGTIVQCSALPGSGASPVSELAAAKALTTLTTYHVRLVATNAGGTSYGSDATFTTH